MLRVESLSLSYGRALALEAVDLEVGAGEVVSVIGPNGAGKTSLLRGLSGLEPVRGRVVFDERRIDNLPPHRIVRRGLIHCPQSAQLFAEMSVEENLRLGGFALSGARNAARMRDFVLELFPPLRERRDQQAGTLSGGERQMVAVGRALMAEPRLLMLDEPSLGLAPVVRDRIEDAIRQIVSELDLTVLLVEQDTSLALEIGDRVYILDSGRIVKAGTPDEVARDSAIQEAYLGVA